jgi:Na+/melibiose symporter-like transporter
MYCLDYFKEDRNMAPLQKRAFYGLIVCVLWAIALVVIFITIGGIDSLVADRGSEAWLVGTLIAGFLAYVITLVATRGKRGEVTMDERDRAILAKARATQLWSAMLTLAVWAVSLSRIYSEPGLLPVQCLYLITMSTWIVVVVTENAAILIGYRRS